MTKFTVSRLGVGVALMLFFGTHATADVVYSLSGNFSNTSNPIGVWSYNYDVGKTITVHQATWDTGDFGASQPAWAFGTNGANGLIPAWFLSTGHISSSFDMPAGHVIVHTDDTASGYNGGLTPANVTWTSPINGTIAISGDTWLARKTNGRTDDWSLSLNSTTLASGIVAYTDSFTSVNPSLFGTFFEQIHIGDVVTFQAVKDQRSPFGEFEGVDLTITVLPTATAVPEPASLLLFGVAFSGAIISTRSWRKRRALCAPTVSPNISEEL